MQSHLTLIILHNARRLTVPLCCALIDVIRLRCVSGDVEGHFRTGVAESDTTALSDPQSCLGHDQELFPRGRQRPEEQLPGELHRVAVSVTRSLTLHSDYGHAHQELCLLAVHARYVSI